MAELTIYDKLLAHLNRKTAISEKSLADYFHLDVHSLHLIIKDINQEQLIILKNENGYLLNNDFHYTKSKSWRRIKTAIVYADYEHSEHYTYDKLKQFEHDIMITGVYHLYQPISTSRTEFIINASGFRPNIFVPYVMISPAFDEQDILAIKKTIKEIKEQIF